MWCFGDAGYFLFFFLFVFYCFWLQLTDFSLLCFSYNHQEAETRFVPSVQDFDKKLAEADAYLQILIDQLKVGLSGPIQAGQLF